MLSAGSDSASIQGPSTHYLTVRSDNYCEYSLSCMPYIHDTSFDYHNNIFVIFLCNYISIIFCFVWLKIDKVVRLPSNFSYIVMPWIHSGVMFSYKFINLSINCFSKQRFLYMTKKKHKRWNKKLEFVRIVCIYLSRSCWCVPRLILYTIHERLKLLITLKQNNEIRFLFNYDCWLNFVRI